MRVLAIICLVLGFLASAYFFDRAESIMHEIFSVLVLILFTLLALVCLGFDHAKPKPI